MNPLAPEVVAPLSVCSTSVEIRGNIAGASIDILVDGSVISTHPTNTADNYYPLGATLAANQKVTARQTISGATSPEGLPVTVQDVPAQLSALTVETHPYNCARCVLVTGGVPGEKVEAMIGTQTVGSATVISGFANITYTPALPPGQALTLKQSTCNNLTATQSTALATAPQSPPPAPQIQIPLIECQNSITVSGVLDGAYVEIYRNNTLENIVALGISQEWWWIKPLVLGDVIKVRQGFNCKTAGSPLENPSPYVTATVQSVSKLNKPIFVSTPCPGSTYITLANLIPGARVVLLQNGVEIGETDTPTPTYTFITPPLQSGATLKAHMVMCTNKAGPDGTTQVAAQPQSPSEVKISDPYACAAFVYVAVNGNPGNYLLYLTNNNGQQISTYYNLVGSHGLVPVSPSLVAGDQITLNLMGCGGNWTKYGPYTVLSGAPQPSLPQPVQGGYGSCTVVSPACGALLDVYVGNVWKGSAISEGNLAATVVPLSVTLQPGDQVTCIQTLCGIASKPTPPSTVTKQNPKIPKLISPPDGAANVALQPVFKWQDPGAGTLAQADSFQLVATSGTVTIINSPSTTTSLQSPITLAHGEHVQWNVTAQNSGGKESAINPFTFTTENPPPPQSNLKFVVPILSGIGTFPRDEVFTVSIEVKNFGNAASGAYTVSMQQRTLDDQFALSAIATDPMPALGPNASTLASFLITISDYDLIRLDVVLVVNNSVVDSANRKV